MPFARGPSLSPWLRAIRAGADGRDAEAPSLRLLISPVAAYRHPACRHAPPDRDSEVCWLRCDPPTGRRPATPGRLDGADAGRGLPSTMRVQHGVGIVRLIWGSIRLLFRAVGKVEMVLIGPATGVDHARPRMPAACLGSRPVPYISALAALPDPMIGAPVSGCASRGLTPIPRLLDIDGPDSMPHQTFPCSGLCRDPAPGAPFLSRSVPGNAFFSATRPSECTGIRSPGTTRSHFDRFRLPSLHKSHSKYLHRRFPPPLVPSLRPSVFRP